MRKVLIILPAAAHKHEKCCAVRKIHSFTGKVKKKEGVGHRLLGVSLKKMF